MCNTAQYRVFNRQCNIKAPPVRATVLQYLKNQHVGIVRHAGIRVQKPENSAAGSSSTCPHLQGATLCGGQESVNEWSSQVDRMIITATINQYDLMTPSAKRLQGNA
jgi:hypothetical protein